MTELVASKDREDREAVPETVNEQTGQRDAWNVVAEPRREADVMHAAGLRRRQDRQRKEDDIAPERFAAQSIRRRRRNDHRRLLGDRR